MTETPQAMTQISKGGRKLALVLRCVIATLLISFVALAGLTKLAMHAMGPPPLEIVEQQSRTVSDHKGRLLRAFTTPDGKWRMPLSPENVSPHYLKILLAYEDKRFYEHGGVDPFALARALGQFIKNGRIVSGASTITMQVARLIERKHERTLAGKIRQILRAFQLEEIFSKEEILTLYLTLAPMGGNIEGVRAASLAYFGKEPIRLSLADAATLTALPQSPEARRPDKYPDRGRRARNKILGRMATYGVITTRDADRARAQAFPSRRHAFPKYAPHLAERLFKERPGDNSINLTINRDHQASLETLAKTHARRHGPHLSVAILAIENKTGNVLAHIGSSDYFNEDRFGAIDMTSAIRSPGSALKPFIFGLAFEAGQAHPETLIEDRPVRYGPYTPKNFDNTYRGTVTVRKALQLSLNIPSVKLLNAIGPARLLGRFQKTRSNVILPPNSAPSLAMALGGLGLKLSDLARLYVALARGGEMIQLNYDVAPNGPPSDTRAEEVTPTRLLDPIATWQVTDILRGSPPPTNARAGVIAYKTGTSYGFRDALAIGYDGRHTIAIWIGRPDSIATPGLTGRHAAAPILFDAFARLSQTRAPFPKAPDDVLIATGAELPPPLRRFRDDSAGIFVGSVNTRPLMIAFPPAGSELETEKADNGNATPLTLKAEGGVLPLTWLVNGAPIPSRAHRRSTSWTPPGEGFVNLSVIDAKGNVDRLTVRLR